MERIPAVKFLLMLVILSTVLIGDVALMTLVARTIEEGQGWETFPSDLVVGIITTGGLGLLLWYFTRKIERDAESRGTKRTAQLRWSVVGRRVGNIVNTVDFADNTTDASDLGPVAHDLINLLQDEPLAEWQEALNSEEIQLVLVALNRLETTVGLGKALNSAIDFSFRTTARRSRVSPEKAREMLIGSSLSMDWRTLPGRLGIANEELDDVEADLAAMTATGLKETMGAYSMSRRMAEADVERLRTKVVVPNTISHY